MEVLRIDLVFSYWIYAWYVLYTFKMIRYSPKLALTIGLIYNFMILIMMLLYDTRIKTIISFIVINTLIKVFPLYYLINEKILLKDVYFTIGLFIVFIIWLHINNQSLKGNAKIIYNSLLYGKNKTPLMALLQKINNTIKKEFKT